MRIGVSLSTGLMLGMVTACTVPGDSGANGGAPGISVAETALRTGAPGMALQICAETLQREPGNFKAMLCRGQALVALGQTGPAEAAFSQAVETEPKSAEALVGLGRLRLSRDPAAAEVLFARAVDAAPKDTVAWNNLGVARDSLGRHLLAQVAYRRALEIAPHDSAIKVNLALSLAISGRAEEGVQIMHSLGVDPESDPRLRANLAAVLAMGGRSNEASALLGSDMPPDQVEQTIAGYQDLVRKDLAAQAGGAPAASVSSPAGMPAAGTTPAPVASTSARQQPYVVPSSAPWSVGPGGEGSGGRSPAAPARPAPAPVTTAPAPPSGEAAPPAEPQAAPAMQAAASVPASAPVSGEAAPMAAAQASAADYSTLQHQRPYVAPSQAPWTVGPRAGKREALSVAMVTAQISAPDHAAPGNSTADYSTLQHQLPYVVPALAPWALGPGEKERVALSSRPVPTPRPVAAPTPIQPAPAAAGGPSASAALGRQQPYVVPSAAPWEIGPAAPAHAARSSARHAALAVPPQVPPAPPAASPRPTASAAAFVPEEPYAVPFVTQWKQDPALSRAATQWGSKAGTVAAATPASSGAVPPSAVLPTTTGP